MIGITAYGGYVPWPFIERQRIFKAMGWFNPATYGIARGIRSVANFDEDSLTLAVAAARDCLGGSRASQLDALYLASTTLPYKERLNSAIAVAALNAGASVRALDVGGSLRAGTSALMSALDAVKAGSASHGLVAAADTRTAKMGSRSEHGFGDGAAAVTVGRANTIANLVGACSVTVDFPDHVRGDLDRFDRAWEDRWIATEGYGNLIPRAVNELLNQTGVELANVAQLAIGCPEPRVIAGLARQLGLPPDRFTDNLAATIGDTGAALPLMMLVSALEQAAPGDKVVVAGFGSGCDALMFEATDRLPAARARHRGIAGHLGASQRRDLGSYEKYAAFRNLLPLELGIRGEANPITAHTVLARERCAILGLVGARCEACGTPQYPPQRVCVSPTCRAIDRMTAYPFADRPASVFTYTGDNLAFTVDPPAIYGICDFDGGGRMQLDFTDCALGDLTVGMPVEMTFRRKYVDSARAMSGYFWKARPVRDAKRG